MGWEKSRSGIQPVSTASKASDQGAATAALTKQRELGRKKRRRKKDGQSERKTAKAGNTSSQRVQQVIVNEEMALKGTLIVLSFEPQHFAAIKLFFSSIILGFEKLLMLQIASC